MAPKITASREPIPKIQRIERTKEAIARPFHLGVGHTLGARGPVVEGSPGGTAVSAPGWATQGGSGEFACEPLPGLLPAWPDGSKTQAPSPVAP